MADFESLYTRRLDRLLNSNDSNTLFTSTRRQEAINDGYQEFAGLIECYQRGSTIRVSCNTTEYVLSTIWKFTRIGEQGLVEYHHTSSGSSGRTVQMAGFDFERPDELWLNRYEAGWRASTSPVADPRNYYIRFDDGNQVLGLSDPPKVGSSETAQLVVPFVAWPTPMTASTQIPFTDTNGATRHGLAEYHQAFVHYAADAVGASVADESESGTYGRCLIDGGPIDPKRLDAVPWAPYCVRHQKLLEVPNLVIGGGTWWARTVYCRTSSRGSAMSSSGSKDAMGDHRRE